jgi:ankyrin repeat protein
MIFALAAFAWVGSTRAGEIHNAAALGELEKVKTILTGRPELANSRDNNGWQPIHHAAYGGNKEILELLLTYKADINAKVEQRHPAGGNLNWTPLHIAADRGRIEVVRYLIEKGANLEAKDVYDQTPLFLACLQGNTEVLQVLVEAKADVNPKNKKGKTPLQRAIEAEKRAVIEFLRANGAQESQ